jgi:hypothetical protein
MPDRTTRSVWNRRTFLRRATAASLGTFAMLTGAGQTAAYARNVLGKVPPATPGEMPTEICVPIDHCAVCTCAGDRYYCYCNDGSYDYRTCANGHNCSQWTVGACIQG